MRPGRTVVNIVSRLITDKAHLGFNAVSYVVSRPSTIETYHILVFRIHNLFDPEEDQ